MIEESELRTVLAELSVLVGGRIQRVDVVADREIVLELRFAGRTLRLLLSARPGMGRVHLVDARPPREVEGGDLQRVLRKRLEGRPLVVLEGARRTVRLDARDHVLVVRLDGGKDAFTWQPASGLAVPSPPDPSRLPANFPVSAAIAARFAGPVASDAASALRAELERRIGAQLKKHQRLEANVARDRAKLAAMEDNRRLGLLLTTVLARVPRGASSFECLDYTTGETVIVPLDPSVSAKLNMERYFGRAKKAERGLPLVDRRLTQIQRELEHLRALKAQLRDADLDTLRGLAEDERQGASARRAGASGAETSEPSGLLERRAPPRGKKKPIDKWSRRFEALDGTEIRVGRGAEENDRLTLSAARGDDIWLHASGAGGAHVLLRVPKGGKPSSEALLDAAHLAAFYSALRRDSRVEVVYTEARYVRKTKGDPPGRVSVARGKTLLIEPDPARIERLFGRSGEGRL